MQTITKEKISFGVTPNNCNRTSQKKISGFQEWASKSINIVTGCSNNCKYCYARAIFTRFNKSKGQEWKDEVIRPEAVEKGYRKYKGKVGFPSTHDITPNNLDACLIVLKKLLVAGNDVLIVSKPNFECIKRLCDELSDYMDQILWRFTISTMDDEISMFWEENAPLSAERKRALKYAFETGFKTSVSMEPLLDSGNVLATVYNLAPYVTGKFWIGKMNRIPSLKNSDGLPPDPYTQNHIDRIRKGQTKKRIKEIYAAFQELPELFAMIKWKESYKKVLGIEFANTPGLDI